jgi:hypothetical protein
MGGSQCIRMKVEIQVGYSQSFAANLTSPLG